MLKIELNKQNCQVTGEWCQYWGFVLDDGIGEEINYWSRKTRRILSKIFTRLTKLFVKIGCFPSNSCIANLIGA